MSVLVLGDQMIDRYLWGDVTRISPEAPVPVNRVERVEERAGGAANVLLNIRGMGSAAHGWFGLEQPPIVKIRVIGKNQQMLRIDFDMEQKPIERHWVWTLSEGCKVVVFSDYGKGTLSDIKPLIDAALSRGCKVLVDPKGFDYERYRGAHVIKPNKDEMKELVGGWSTEEQLTKKALKLREDLNLEALLLTRAAEGMTLYTAEGAHSFPSEAQEIFDVSGAGDTAIAAFAVALDHGHDLPTAAKYANKAAGIAVRHFGTYVATEEEVFGAH